MSTASLKIDPDNLPDEGIDLVGTLPKAALALDPADKVQPLSDLDYDIHVQRDDAGLMLLGTLDATFELECGRCLERFPMQMTLSDYVGEVEIEGENKSIIDLTETLRDDILVALPSYPRCEDGNVNERECPAQGRFDAQASLAASADDAPQDTGIWDALDQLQN